MSWLPHSAASALSHSVLFAYMVLEMSGHFTVQGKKKNGLACEARASAVRTIVERFCGALDLGS